jgi:hypothetical protein
LGRKGEMEKGEKEKGEKEKGERRKEKGFLMFYFLLAFIVVFHFIFI